MEKLLLGFIPVFHLALSPVIFGFALQCPTLRHRLYFLPLFLTFSFLSFTSSKKLSFLPSLVSLWCLGISLYILHITSLLYIERYPPLLSPPTTQDAQKLWVIKLRAIYKLSGNPQLHFKSYDEHATPKPEKYAVFYFLRVIKLPVYYYTQLHAIPSIFSEIILEI